MDQPKTIAAITTDQMLRAGLSRLSVLRMAALSPKGARVHRTIYDMEIQDLKEKVLILSLTLHANSYNLPSFQL